MVNFLSFQKSTIVGAASILLHERSCKEYLYNAERRDTERLGRNLGCGTRRAAEAAFPKGSFDWSYLLLHVAGEKIHEAPRIPLLWRRK
jgi:hypothetical protein